MKKLRITVLGSGTSSGVPYIHCKCPVCRSTNPKNKRLRSSIWIQAEGKSLLVDVSPDFRQQALRTKIPRLDAILFTHPHADHIGGLDDLRGYSFIQNEVIPAYGHDWTLKDLPARYPYIFNGDKPEGGGIAKLDLREFKLNAPKFTAAGVDIIPLELKHGSKFVAGFRIGNFAYITDCHLIPRFTLDKLRGLETLILDCVRVAKHNTHLNLEESLEYARQIGAKKTFLTHLSHDFDQVKASRTLPKSIALAYDGLILKSD